MIINNAVQEMVLEEIVEESVPVTVYLTNGFQLRGIVSKCDDTLIVLEAEDRQKLLYWHAISTIEPLRPLHCLKEK